MNVNDMSIEQNSLEQKYFCKHYKFIMYAMHAWYTFITGHVICEYYCRI